MKRSEILSSRQLAHFVAIVEAGSLGRAATALRLTEPALSKSIRSLERLLDVKLFDRGPRGFDLTPFGESLLDHARVILTEFRRTHADIAELRGAEAGRVYVGTGPTFASTLVPRAVMALLAKRPAVRVTIYEGYGDTLVPMTLRGELDFFVTVLPSVVPDPTLMQEALMHDVAHIVVRAGHPLAPKPDVGLVELQHASWMLTGTSDLLRQRIDEMFTRAGLDPPKPVIEAASTNFMRSMLLSADLVSMLPKRIIERELASGELVTLSPSEFDARRTVGVVQRRWASRSPACTMLLEELRTVCRQEMAEVMTAPA